MASKTKLNAASYLLNMGAAAPAAQKNEPALTPVAAEQTQAENADTAGQGSSTTSAKPVRFSLYLSPENADYVEAMTAMLGESKNAFVNEALDKIRLADEEYPQVKAAFDILRAHKK